MLDHLHHHRRDIEHLPAGSPDLDRVGQLPTTPCTRDRFMTDDQVRGRDLLEARAGMPLLPAPRRTQRLRLRLHQPVRGRRVGFDEFRDDDARRASRSEIRVRASASSARNSAINDSSSATDGESDTPQP